MTGYKEQFDQLQTLIKNRQLFEKEHPWPPYSTYPTTIDFKNINGDSLIKLAVKMGDLSSVKSLVKDGASIDTIIDSALALDHLEIAKWLYDKGAALGHISLSDVKPGPCYQWFSERIKKDVEKQLKEVNVKANSGQAFFKPSHVKKPERKPIFDEESVTIYPSSRSGNKYFGERIAEIGHIDALDFYQKNNRFTYEETKNNLLIVASANNQIEMMNRLIDDGAAIQPELLYQDSPLLKAAKHNHLDALKLLLAKGVNVNYPGKQKFTPLMAAVSKNNLEAVELLLKLGADVSLKTTTGDNVFYFTLRHGNQDIIIALLKHDLLQTEVNAPDIYGHTPLERSYQFKDVANQEIRRLSELSGIDSSDITKQSIAQYNVDNNMRYYLISQYRSLDYFNEAGHCNGWTHLFLYYASQGRADYFEDTLRLMASWDGTDKALDKPFINIPQTEYYNNLRQLFEQWINDVTVFQHAFNQSESGISKLTKHTQDDRLYQHQILQSAYIPKPISTVLTMNTSPLQFQELMTIYSQRMAKGIVFEVGGEAHHTGGLLNARQQFDYYDSNYHARIPSLGSEEALTRLVIDTKIIDFDRYNNGGNVAEKFGSQLYFFYFPDEKINDEIKNHRAFKKSELPKTNEDITEFIKKSPNGFSQLHVAVIAGSVKSIHDLLSSGLFSIVDKDKHGKSAIDLAITSNNEAVIAVMMGFYKDEIKLSIESIITLYDENKISQLKQRLKFHHQFDLRPLFFNVLLSGDIKFLSYLLKHHMVDVNERYNNETPLRSVLKSSTVNPKEMMTLLLEHGASGETVFQEILVEKTSNWHKLMAYQKLMGMVPELAPEKLNPETQQKEIIALLKIAIEEKDTDVCRVLIKKCSKAMLNDKKDSDESLLTRAVKLIDTESTDESSLDIVKMLINAGCDVDDVSSAGGMDTCLHQIIFRTPKLWRELVTLFIEQGASLDIKDGASKTVRDKLTEIDNPNVWAVFLPEKDNEKRLEM